MALTGRLERAAPAVERVASVPDDDRSAEPRGVADLLASVSPSVVALRATSPSGERFGSGLVIRSDGYALANAHVVDGATSIHLTATDGRSFPARVTGSDPESDLAVLAVADTGLAPAALGSSRGLSAGDMVVAVGGRHRPQGSHSVTTGVIMGLGQVLKMGGRSLYDVVSADTVVTPHASGGPLLDRRGTVVGITVGMPSDEEHQACTAAIPIDRARQVAEQLIAEGSVGYPWLGLAGTDLDPTTAATSGVNRGALVHEVEPQSPAHRSGLHERDVITAVESSPVATADDLTMLVRRHEPGDEIQLTVVRSRAARTVTVRLDRTRNNDPLP